MSNPTATGSSPAGLSPRQNTFTDLQAAGYIREQAVSTRERLETDLVLRTKEGDQVTLSSGSFSSMDAYTYDSAGFVSNESGQAAYSYSQREITLASGQSFSFSVEGNLSEEELDDIESILQGLDEVMSEMRAGDMTEAMDKALGLGNYDTVSSFSADLSYERSYSMRSSFAGVSRNTPMEVDQEAQGATPVPNAETQPEEGLLPVKEKLPGMGFEKFLRQLEKQLENHDGRLIGLAKDPINKLFKHHLDETAGETDAAPALLGALETAMEEINALVEELTGRLFAEQLSEAQPEVQPEAQPEDE